MSNVVIDVSNERDRYAKTNNRIVYVWDRFFEKKNRTTRRLFNKTFTGNCVGHETIETCARVLFQPMRRGLNVHVDCTDRFEYLYIIYY